MPRVSQMDRKELSDYYERNKAVILPAAVGAVTFASIAAYRKGYPHVIKAKANYINQLEEMSEKSALELIRSSIQKSAGVSDLINKFFYSPRFKLTNKIATKFNQKNIDAITPALKLLDEQSAKLKTHNAYMAKHFEDPKDALITIRNEAKSKYLIDKDILGESTNDFSEFLNFKKAMTYNKAALLDKQRMLDEFVATEHEIAKKSPIGPFKFDYNLTDNQYKLDQLAKAKQELYRGRATKAIDGTIVAGVLSGIGYGAYKAKKNRDAKMKSAGIYLQLADNGNQISRRVYKKIKADPDYNSGVRDGAMGKTPRNKNLAYKVGYYQKKLLKKADYQFDPVDAAPAVGAGAAHLVNLKMGAKWGMPRKIGVMAGAVGVGSAAAYALRDNNDTEYAPRVSKEEFAKIRAKDNWVQKTTPSFLRKKQLETEKYGYGDKAFTDKYEASKNNFSDETRNYYKLKGIKN